MGAITAAINDALQQTSPDAVIRDVKHTVARELESLDPRVDVRSTDYFNHTFVPDFVLGWTSGKDERTRDVYLRLDLHDASVGRDLESLASDSPAFIGLAGELNSGNSAGPDFEAFETCLLSSAAALEPLATLKSRSPMAQMVKSSLLQGGRGYMMGRNAHEVTQAANQSDAALADLNGAAVSNALTSLTRNFVPQFSSRMQKVMQVLWASHGGGVEDFPGEGRAESSLSAAELAEILPFILRLAEITNLDFWRSLGKSLSLGLLESLNHFEGSPNLDQLVNANLDRIKAKSMSLDRSDPTLFDDIEAMHWRVDDATLLLSHSEFDLAFVNDRRKIARRTKDLGRTPRWNEIEGRINQFSAEGIEFTAPTSKLRIQSSTAEALTRSTDMDALSSALGEFARVNSIQLRIPLSNDTLEINFDRSVVDSLPAPVSLHVLARYGLDLIYQASPELLRDLELFTSMGSVLPWWTGD